MMLFVKVVEIVLKHRIISIEPLETKFGRKRKVNQSTCNKDFSCVDGFALLL